MNNRKCPHCKECLDLFFSPQGIRLYICWLCGTYYELTLSGLVLLEEDKIKEYGANKISKQFMKE